MALTKLALDKLTLTAIVRVDAITRDFYESFEGEPPEAFPYQETPDVELLQAPDIPIQRPLPPQPGLR